MPDVSAVTYACPWKALAAANAIRITISFGNIIFSVYVCVVRLLTSFGLRQRTHASCVMLTPAISCPVYGALDVNYPTCPELDMGWRTVETWQEIVAAQTSTVTRVMTGHGYIRIKGCQPFCSVACTRLCSEITEHYSVQYRDRLWKSQQMLSAYPP